MLDSVFSILGLSPLTLQVPDTAVLCVLTLVLLFALDWIFKLVYLVIGTLTKRR